VDLTERTPRITPPRGTPDPGDLRTTAPFPALTPKTDPDIGEPMRASLNDLGALGALGGPKFVDPADPRLRTTVHPARTIRDVPAQPSPTSRDPRDRILPERPTEPVRNEAPARTEVVVRSPTPTIDESARALDESRPAAPAEKTKIWVATHKPPVDPDPRLILLCEPDSPRAASFRVLRHRLEQRGNPRVIAVTSAEAGEGKSTMAANLAMAIGECERAKVLLVEANLRTPSLAALFGFLPPTCFALQLYAHREKPLDPWAVVECFSPSLHVLAVKPGQESRPLLDGPAFSHAMDMLKNAGYDYIVVDTPPVLTSADVNLIEDTCEGVLFCGWSGRSSGRSLRGALDQLAPSKILGFALLDV
jgi:Mrp family chromosome partitioning ATPase